MVIIETYQVKKIL